MQFKVPLNQLEQVMNAVKIKFMCYELDSQIQSLESLEGKNPECVTNFEYLSSWIITTSRDIASHMAKTWPALYKLDNIWNSNLPRRLKMQFFRAVDVSILLNGAESWTLAKTHESQLDGTYIWMLHFPLNVHWSQHVTNKQSYGDLPHLSTMIRLHCMKFADHCCWVEEEPILKVLFRTPQYGRRRHGRPTLSYLKLLENDTGMMVGKIQSAMKDRDLWQQYLFERLKQRLDKWWWWLLLLQFSNFYAYKISNYNNFTIDYQL